MAEHQGQGPRPPHDLHPTMLMRPLTMASAGLAAVILLACGDSASQQATADSLSTLGSELAAAQDELQQRDALMGELAQTTRLVNQIDSTLSAVPGLAALQAGARQPAGGPSDPWASRRDSLQAKVDGVIQLLEQSRARVNSLTQSNRAAEGRLSGYVTTIEQLQATVERQQGEISALTTMVDSLRRTGRQLAVERDAVRDTLRTTLTETNAVYYVIGTRSQLGEAEIVRSEGSRRFLIVGSRTLVPSRTLDPADFQVADMRDELVIPLPDPNARYTVISRHDPDLLVAGVGEDGNGDGTLRVTDPTQFWTPSRYLIILQH